MKGGMGMVLVAGGIQRKGNTAYFLADVQS